MNKIDNDYQNLVYYRIQALPPNTTISIGGAGEMNKDAMLDHVRKNDDIGQTIIAAEKKFFDALKTGDLYKAL